MTGLLPWAPPSASRVVVAWLQGYFGVGNVGLKRPTAAALPYRMVTVVAGHEDTQKIRQCSTVSVHTFAATFDLAEHEAQLTHQRMLFMGPPTVGNQTVEITLPDNSTQLVTPEFVTCAQIPIWADYEDDLVQRFVGRYEVGLRFASNP